MKQIITPDFYESIVKNSADFLAVIDASGVYIYISDAVESVTGLTITELLGEDCLRFIHSDDQESMLAALRTVPAQANRLMPPYRMKSGNGGWQWMESRATNLLDNEAVKGFVLSSRKASPQVETKPESGQDIAFYHSLFYNNPDSVFTLDNNGKFTKINSAIGRVSGYTEEELKGGHFMKLVTPASYLVAHTSFEKALAGEPHTAEVDIITKKGKRAILCVTVVPVLVNGIVIGIQGIAKDVTKEKEAEELIRKQAEQLHTIIESIGDPFVVFDDEWRYLYVNTAFAAYFESAPASFEGNIVWEYSPQLSSELFYLKCQEVAKTKQPLYFEETFRGFSNGFTTFSISVYPFPGGVSVYFKDISFEKDLQSEFEKLSMVVSKTTNGIVILNQDRKIEWINSGFTRLTGYSLAEALQEKPHVILRGPGTDAATADRIDEKFEHSIPFSEEVLNYRKSGEEIWLKLNIVPIMNEDREVTKFIAILTDITEKKKSEHRLLQLATDLYRHNRDLQQFTYIVSHNLRAPVANAVGLTNLLHKVEKEAPIYDEALAKLKISLSNLDNVITDLNSVLTIRDSARTTLKEEVNLHAVCQQVINDLQEKYETCGASIELNVNKDYTLFTNHAYLYNIFYSLLINALKFRSENRFLQVSIKCRRFGEKSTAISIADNGSGMDMNKIKNHIFTLYTRFHPRVEGKGIGLFLVKAQVEALGGKIKVKSKPDSGTTFTIFI